MNLRKGLRYANVELDFKEFSKENILQHDLIVPLTIADLKELNQLRDQIENKVIPIPSLSSLEICDNKFLFYQTMSQNGFEHLLPKIDRSLPYPYILKKKVSEGGIDNYIISDQASEQKYADLISSSEYFCQEMVLGYKEYATHILFKNKKS